MLHLETCVNEAWGLDFYWYNFPWVVQRPLVTVCTRDRHRAPPIPGDCLLGPFSPWISTFGSELSSYTKDFLEQQEDGFLRYENPTPL